LHTNEQTQKRDQLVAGNISVYIMAEQEQLSISFASESLVRQ